MLKIEEKYRSSYTGEDIITNRVCEHGVWNATTESVSNAVINNQISSQAVVFGNGLSRLDFDANLIFNHKGGLLGSRKLQTYGCNAMFREYAVDFLIVPDRQLLHEITTTAYENLNIVYTRILNTLEFPGRFYLIPFDPYFDAGSTAAYLAAFDGHKKVFLLGFDGQDTPNFNNNIYSNTNGYDCRTVDINVDSWNANKVLLFSTYTDVDFIYVSTTGRMPLPVAWQAYSNVRQVNYREFILEADL